MPTVDELLALDLLTLREHTEKAGDRLDPEIHRVTLERTLATSKVVVVRRDGKLVAYATLEPQSAGDWFVTGFNTDPGHRSSTVFRELFAKLAAVAEAHGIAALRSNVYKTNARSMAFHKRLGFIVTKENAKGVEFYATVASLMANPAVEPRQ